MLKNPILKGFNPDPCICRKGDDYYIAVSTFEWFPGIPVYHSKDMKNWELYTHVLTDDTNPDLKNFLQQREYGHHVLHIVSRKICSMLCMVS